MVGKTVLDGADWHDKQRVMVPSTDEKTQSFLQIFHNNEDVGKLGILCLHEDKSQLQANKMHLTWVPQ